MTAENGEIRAAQLLVCTKCKHRPEDGSEAVPGAGAHLYERLAASALPEHTTVVPVECLSNCGRGCTIALRGGPERWSYIYGDVTPTEHDAVLLDGLARYVATPDGLIPWRERPVHFRKHCIARLPPQT